MDRSPPDQADYTLLTQHNAELQAEIEHLKAELSRGVCIPFSDHERRVLEVQVKYLKNQVEGLQKVLLTQGINHGVINSILVGNWKANAFEDVRNGDLKEE